TVKTPAFLEKSRSFYLVRLSCGSMIPTNKTARHLSHGIRFSASSARRFQALLSSFCLDRFPHHKSDITAEVHLSFAGCFQSPNVRPYRPNRLSTCVQSAKIRL